MLMLQIEVKMQNFCKIWQLFQEKHKFFWIPLKLWYEIRVVPPGKNLEINKRTGTFIQYSRVPISKITFNPSDFLYILIQNDKTLDSL